MVMKYLFGKYFPRDATNQFSGELACLSASRLSVANRTESKEIDLLSH